MAVVQNSYTSMLSLADIYFYTKTNEGYSYRFQWSTQALQSGVNGVINPNIDNYVDEDGEIDEDYYEARIHYDYIAANQNDNTSLANGFIVKIYDKNTNILVKEVTTTEKFADIVLNDGDYLWEVVALKDGSVIKTSAKSYMQADSNSLNKCYDAYHWAEIESSSEQHQLDVKNWEDSLINADINSLDGNTSSFFVCTGEGQNYYNIEDLYNTALAGGYTCSLAAYALHDCDVVFTENCLLTSSGVYVYKNGQWLYHTYIPGFNAGENCASGNYFSLSENTVNANAQRFIYSYNPLTNDIALHLTANSPVFDFSPGGKYYQCYTGVYSLTTNKPVLLQTVDYGEYKVFDDLAMNIYCLFNNYSKTDDLNEGQAGSLVVAYTPLNGETAGKTVTYTIYQSSDLTFDIESEDVFETKIGNCICYRLPVSDDSNGDISVVHVIENGVVTETITNTFNSYFEYSVNANGDLVAEYYDNYGQKQSEVLYEGVTEPQYADLQISGLTITPDVIQEGEFAWPEINITVANKGKVDASSFKICVYAGADLITEDVIDGLYKNSSCTIGSYIYADSLTAGTHNIKVVVDALNEVNESNENNNVKTATFTVNAKLETKFFTGSFSSAANDMLLVVTADKVSIYNNGNIWSEMAFDSSWEIVGVEDFNRDGQSDILRKHTSGLILTDLSNGDGTFSGQIVNMLGAGWDIEATGDFDGDGNGDVLVADPDASAVIGLIGYWKDGTAWTLIDGYSPEWEMISASDFDGDGTTDMLWRNTFTGVDGYTHNAYCSWIMNNSNSWRIVSSARPDQWDYLCSGDFDGDGTTDMAMIDSNGIVGIWGIKDGTMGGWAVLGSVDLSVSQLAGVGDYDGDGTDDIAWCDTTNGITAYWQIKNNAINSVQTVGIIA